MLLEIVFIFKKYFFSLVVLYLLWYYSIYFGSTLFTLVCAVERVIPGLGKRTLIDLENELLRLLNESRGSLLEDAELFNTLKVSKATSVAVTKSLEISEITEKEIDNAREGYRPSAKRASILFFVLNDMGKIDPMYQFAMDSYIFLFTQSIEKSAKSANLDDRIVALNDYHTYAVYK